MSRSAAAKKTPASSGLVTRGEYEALVERLDNLEDVVRVQTIQKKGESRNRLPIELVDRMIAGEHPVRIWREHRGMSVNELARKTDVPSSYLSEIENGKKPGSLAAMRALAKGLGVTMDDLA